MATNGSKYNGDGGDSPPKQIIDSSLQVPDKQYTKRRRHKSINDARDRVPSTMLDIEKLLMQREIHSKEGNRALQRTVETLAMEMFWMLQQHPEGEDFLFNRELGQLTMTPPPNVQGEIVDGGFIGDMPDTPHEFPVVQYNGLQSLLTGPDKVTAEFVIQQENYLGSNDQTRVVVDEYTPRHVVKEAYLSCVEFLGKADFGIEFSEDRPLAKVTPDPHGDTPPAIQSLYQTDLYKKNEKLTVTGDNDHLIVISASSRTPVSGTGKTTLATTIAKALDTSEDGYDAEKKATFDVDEFGYEIISNVKDGSAIVYDEAQGTQSGTGLNAMRSQKNEAIDTVNGILNNRDKHITAIIIVQDMKMLNTSMYSTVDSWIMIKKGVEERHGPMATHHSLQKNDYDWGNPQPKTPALEDLTWDPLPKSDPDYAAMEKMKQASKTSKQEKEEDAELPKEQQILLAQEYRDMGKSLLWIDENAESITFSREWIRQNTEAGSDEVAADD